MSIKSQFAFTLKILFQIGSIADLSNENRLAVYFKNAHLLLSDLQISIPEYCCRFPLDPQGLKP